MCGAEIPPEGCQPRFAYIASMDGAEFATNAKHIKKGHAEWRGSERINVKHASQIYTKHTFKITLGNTRCGIRIGGMQHYSEHFGQGLRTSCKVIHMKKQM